MELLFVFFYQILVGVIFLINFIKCGEPYCETLTAGTQDGHLVEKIVKSYAADDVIAVHFESQCDEPVGVEAYGCYREPFNMSIDPDLQSLSVVRNESNLSVEILVHLKVYCAKHNYTEFSLNNSQKGNNSDQLEKCNNTKEESTTDLALETAETENSTPQFTAETFNRELSTSEYTASNHLEKERRVKTTTERPQVCQELDEDPEKVQRGVVKALKNVDKAQVNVNYAQNTVEIARKGVELAAKQVQTAELALEKAQRDLVKAQRGVDKALKDVDKAEKKVEKAEQGVNKVLNLVDC